MTSAPHPGLRVEETISVLGSRIPLRPGAWRVLAEGRSNDTTTSTRDYWLGRLEDGRMQEATRVWSRVSTAETAADYGSLRFFDNDLYRVTEGNDSGGVQAGWCIQNRITWAWKTPYDKTTGIMNIEAAAAEKLAQGRISFPSEFLVAQFALRNRSKFLQVSEYFSPESSGLSVATTDLPSWKESAFAPLRIRQNARNFAYFQGIVGWAEGWWPKIKSSFSTFYPEGF